MARPVIDNLRVRAQQVAKDLWDYGYGSLNREDDWAIRQFLYGLVEGDEGRLADLLELLRKVREEGAWTIEIPPDWKHGDLWPPP